MTVSLPHSNTISSPMVVLNGGASSDPSRVPGALRYAWSCTFQSSGAPCFGVDTALTLTLALGSDSPTFAIDAIMFANVFDKVRVRAAAFFLVSLSESWISTCMSP